MSPLPRQGWLFLIEFLKWYFSKYWQVRTRPVFAQTVTYVTGPGKKGLIYTKYTCLYYGTYIQFCVCYSKSVSFIEFLMDLCTYDDILDATQITDKKVLHFKLSKSGQILCVDKTCFPRPGHIWQL